MRNGASKAGIGGEAGIGNTFSLSWADFLPHQKPMGPFLSIVGKCLAPLSPNPIQVRII